MFEVVDVDVIVAVVVVVVVVVVGGSASHCSLQDVIQEPSLQYLFTVQSGE